MRKHRRKKTGRGFGCLLLMLALLGGVLLFRALDAGKPASTENPAALTTAVPEAASAAEVPSAAEVTPAAAAPVSPAAIPAAEPAAQTPNPTPGPGTETEQTAAPTDGELPPRPTPWRSMSYSEKSYFLVTDMVYAYRHEQSAAMETIRGRIEELRAIDPELAAVWENVMEYWDYINTAQEVRYGDLPDDLPRDKSLCLVVLGFQLLPDGGMDPELVGRCETALRCAEQYPNAWVLVTGGGTALRKPEITEAGQMAAWLAEHGVDRDRILVEERSRTTAENASYSDAILYAHPEIRSLAIVTSDYHVGMGSLMFHTIAQRRAYETGEEPYVVAANAAFPASDREGTEDPAKQATFLWSLMDPQRGG